MRNELEAKVLELQDANINVKNATKQFKNTIDKEDFGLNEKDKDDAKKIQQAAKVIDDFLQANMDAIDKNDKNLDELDKHLVEYKKVQIANRFMSSTLDCPSEPCPPAECSMDDDVITALRAISERIKRLEGSIKAEASEREGLEGQFKVTDGQVDALVASMGVWTRGGISRKIDDIDSATADLKKRIDAIEKKTKH